MTEKYFIQSVKFSKQFYLIIKLAKEKEPSLAATMKIQYGWINLSSVLCPYYFEKSPVFYSIIRILICFISKSSTKIKIHTECIFREPEIVYEFESNSNLNYEKSERRK